MVAGDRDDIPGMNARIQPYLSPARETGVRLVLLRAVLAASVLGALGPLTTSQLVVSTSKSTYEPKEAVVIGEKLVNPTMRPITYSTTTEGTVATIIYRIELVDPDNNALGAPAFQVERNGSQVLGVKTISFYGVSSGFGGTIGPGSSASLGGTLGFGVPFNLLLAPPTITGAQLELLTDTNQSIALAPGERLALLTQGAYRVTALIDQIEVNGYLYKGSTTGRLVAETMFDVRAPKKQLQGSAGAPSSAR